MSKYVHTGCLFQAAVFIALCFTLANAGIAQDQVTRALSFEYSSPVLATRGDATLTHIELDARIQVIPEVDRAGVVSGPERLEKLIEGQLEIIDFANKAIEAGILEDELVHAQLYMMVSAWLAEQYREKVLTEHALDDYTDQAREIYLLNPDRFKAEPSISFTHLLISSPDDGERQAAEFLSRVQSGESLSALAAIHSEDPSVVNNQGKFNTIELNMLEARFRAGVEAMSQGEVALVESGFGWHVVQLDEILPERTVPFEEVEQELIEEARDQHRRVIVERLLREHYSNALNIAEGGVAQILDRYVPMQGR